MSIYNINLCFISKNKKELKRLLSRLTVRNCIDSATGDIETNIEYLAKDFGIDYDTEKYEGDIWLVSSILRNRKEKTYYIYMTVTINWRPEEFLWDKILSYYPSINYFYKLQESTEKLYINTDVNRIYLFSNYELIINYNKIKDKNFNKYFNSELPFIYKDTSYSDFRELGDYMKEITGKDFKSIEEINKYLKEAEIDNPNSEFALYKYKAPNKIDLHK